ncbi:MAG: carboxypeptidase regulatory-like domain-containing protein, partial [Lentisphaerae bacterium]|nr:carboxypeptidase regulatory-like domain-containing protein [Lentisphaerota bacterium]
MLAVILFFSIRRSASSREEETLREDNAAEVPTPPESSLAGAPEPTEQQMMEQVAQAKRDDALRYSREELSTARHFMNRDGARAKITLKIIDQEGAPVVGATIKAYFTQPEGSSNSALVVGVSDGNGLFTMEKLTKYQCRWEISKKGFYETQGRYEWQSKFTMEAYR